MQRSTPQRRHRQHRFPGLPVEDCWQCGRSRAVCRAKLAFASVAEADMWVAEMHASSGYAARMVRYPCVWCPGWHMATAKTPTALRRVEKARRKALRQAPGTAG